MRFKFRVCQLGVVLLTSRHYCDFSFKAVLPAGAMTRRWAPQTRYTLQRNTASIIKDLTIILFQASGSVRGIIAISVVGELRVSATFVPTLSVRHM